MGLESNQQDDEKKKQDDKKKNKTTTIRISEDPAKFVEKFSEKTAYVVGFREEVSKRIINDIFTEVNKNNILKQGGSMVLLENGSYWVNFTYHDLD